MPDGYALQLPEQDCQGLEWIPESLLLLDLSVAVAAIASLPSTSVESMPSH